MLIVVLAGAALLHCPVAQIPASPYACIGLYVSTVTVADHEYVGLIDTGSEICFVDKEFYDESIAEQTSPSGTTRIVLADGTVQSAPVFVLPIQLHSHRKLNAVASCTDYANISSVLGYDIKVVVGMSYLQQYPTRFHGGNGTAIQLEKKNQLLKSAPSPLTTRSNRPLVSVTLPVLGARRFLIDTGMNNAIALEPAYLKMLERSGYAIRVADTPRQQMNGDGTLHTESAYWLRRIEINGQQFENIFATTGKESIIGMGILRYFDMTIDCPGSRLWMDALPAADGATFAPSATGFGFKFDPLHQLFVVHNIRPNSPAEFAGIQSGDEITEIDGTSVEKYTYNSVRDRFSEGGTTLQLKCRRDGKDFEVDLVLKHRYQYPPEWPPEREEFNPDAVPEK